MSAKKTTWTHAALHLAASQQFTVAEQQAAEWLAVTDSEGEKIITSDDVLAVLRCRQAHRRAT
jgi:hypothetical protein